MRLVERTVLTQAWKAWMDWAAARQMGEIEVCAPRYAPRAAASTGCATRLSATVRFSGEAWSWGDARICREPEIQSPR